MPCSLPQTQERPYLFSSLYLFWSFRCIILLRDYRSASFPTSRIPTTRCFEPRVCLILASACQPGLRDASFWTRIFAPARFVPLCVCLLARRSCLLSLLTLWKTYPACFISLLCCLPSSVSPLAHTPASLRHLYLISQRLVHYLDLQLLHSNVFDMIQSWDNHTNISIQHCHIWDRHRRFGLGNWTPLQTAGCSQIRLQYVTVQWLMYSNLLRLLYLVPTYHTPTLPLQYRRPVVDKGCHVKAHYCKYWIGCRQNDGSEGWRHALTAVTYSRPNTVI